VPESNTYLEEAVTRLAQGLESLTDSDGNDIVETAQLFLEPYPSGPNWVCLHTFGLARSEEVQGFPMLEQTWNVNMRIGTGNLNQEYGGIQQTKLWQRAPIITNWITEHPHLQFEGATDLLTYLDTTIGVKVAPGAVQSRVENLETGKFLWAEVIVQIPFRVPMKIIKYQDGQLIEVT
jgi:hypothetical protein